MHPVHHFGKVLRDERFAEVISSLGSIFGDNYVRGPKIQAQGSQNLGRMFLILRVFCMVQTTSVLK